MIMRKAPPLFQTRLILNFSKPRPFISSTQIGADRSTTSINMSMYRSFLKSVWNNFKVDVGHSASLMKPKKHLESDIRKGLATSNLSNGNRRWQDRVKSLTSKDSDPRNHANNILAPEFVLTKPAVPVSHDPA